MVKITNGSVEREVTKGAFDNLYSKMGFEIVQPKVSSKPEVTKNKENKENKENEDAKESDKDSKRPSK